MRTVAVAVAWVLLVPSDIFIIKKKKIANGEYIIFFSWPLVTSFFSPHWTIYHYLQLVYFTCQAAFFYNLCF